MNYLLKLMLTRTVEMNILGGDEPKFKTARLEQQHHQKAGCAFGCATSFWTGLLLAVLVSSSQPDAQPAFCCEPTGCGPIEDEAMKCPSSYPLVLRRKDDSVVHVNMPCNRWTCAVCRQRKVTEWSRHASKCFQPHAQMSWAVCSVEVIESLNRFILRHECERITVQQGETAVVFVNKHLNHPKITFHPVSPEDAAIQFGTALTCAQFVKHGHPVTTSRGWKRQDDKQREFEYVAGGVSREQFNACAEHLEVPVKTKNIYGADVAIAISDEQKLDSLCNLLVKCPRKHKPVGLFNRGKTDKDDHSTPMRSWNHPERAGFATCCT